MYLQCCLIGTWLVPRETAAISARSVNTIQPCTMSRHFMQIHIEKIMCKRLQVSLNCIGCSINICIQRKYLVFFCFVLLLLLLFCFEVAVLVQSLLMKTRKGLLIVTLVTCLILFLQYPVLFFMKSLTHTSWHKMSALTVVFSRLCRTSETKLTVRVPKQD